MLYKGNVRCSTYLIYQHRLFPEPLHEWSWVYDGEHDHYYVFSSWRTERILTPKKTTQAFSPARSITNSKQVPTRKEAEKILNVFTDTTAPQHIITRKGVLISWGLAFVQRNEITSRCISRSWLPAFLKRVWYNEWAPDWLSSAIIIIATPFRWNYEKTDIFLRAKFSSHIYPKDYQSIAVKTDHSYPLSPHQMSISSNSN